MGFAEDLQGLGLDLNRYSMKNMPAFEPHRVAPILYAVTELWHPPVDNPDAGDRYVRLISARKKFERSIVDEAWANDVVKDLKETWISITELPSKQRDAFQISYQEKADEGRIAYRDFITPYRQDDPIRQIRDDVEKAHTLEEMDIVLTSLKKAMGKSPLVLSDDQELKDFNAKLNVRWDMFSKDLSDPKLLTGFVRTEGPIQAHMISSEMKVDKDLVQKHRNWILDICDKMRAAGEKSPDAKSANREFAKTYQCEKAITFAADPKKRANLELAKKASSIVEQQMESVNIVADLYEKMMAESSGLHRDSKEYTEMKLQAALVVELKKSYNPDDKVSVASMELELDKLHAAAKKYADKEAFKSKKTTLGIERKNTVLTLLAVTDPKGMEGLTQYMTDSKQSVRDFRRDKKEDKKARSLQSLIDEEKASAHDLAPERREHRRARERAKQATLPQDTAQIG